MTNLLLNLRPKGGGGGEEREGGQEGREEGVRVKQL